jgi:GTP-binding protein EngB required for normal cell division
MTHSDKDKLPSKIQEFLKLHPIENEEITLVAEVSFQNEGYWGEDEIKGWFFASDYRSGVIGGEKELLYFTTSYMDIRNVHIEGGIKGQTLQWIHGDKWEDTASDFYCFLQFQLESDAEQALEQIYNNRFDDPHPETIERFKEVYELVHAGKFDDAIKLLNQLKDLDSLCSVVDVFMVRTLHLSGKLFEAATYAARNLLMQIYFKPEIVLYEYVWYEWHPGALRLLPDAASMDSEDPPVIAPILNAIDAKSKGDSLNFVKHVCEALVLYNKSSEGFEAHSFLVLYQLIGYLTDSTKSYIKDTIDQLFNRNREFYEEYPEFFTMVEQFISVIESDKNFNYVAWLSNLETGDASGEINKYKLLLEEKFDLLRHFQNSPSDKNLPDDWNVYNFIGLNASSWMSIPSLEKVKDDAYKAIAETQIMGAKSSGGPGMLYNLGTSENEQKLKIMQEEELLYLLVLTRAGQWLSSGNSEKALIELYKWKKQNKNSIGVYTSPFLRIAEPIYKMYEAWAFKSPQLIRDLLQEIPQQAPFRWLHELFNHVIQRLENESIEVTHAFVKHQLGKAVGYAGELARMVHIDPAVRNKTEKFERTINESLIEADLVESLMQSAASNEVGVMQTAKSGFFGKVKSLFTSKSASVAAVVPERKAIRIAIAGESSAGKTTLMNRIFQTNIFFVTQEEATGVPTEVRYADKMRIEVWDQNNNLRQTMDIEAAWLNEQGTMILEEHVEPVRAFIAEHTRVGSSAMEWVDHVTVYLPLRQLPEHVVLIDTPGFNADHKRALITQGLMKTCNMCLYIMDARNALKGKETETLDFIRREAGKTFIVLNKMDLVLGDDELDCDGGDAADETIARVRNDLGVLFQVPDVIVYPVCSIPASQIDSEASRYALHLETLMDKVFREAVDLQFDLVIDASAKTAVEVHQEIDRTVLESIKRQEEQLLLMERQVPQDFSMFEDEVSFVLRNSMVRHRSAFIDNIDRVNKESFDMAVDQFVDWLSNVSSAKQLKNEVQANAESALQRALDKIDTARKRELENMGRQVSNDAIEFFNDLYQNLPFQTSFDSKQLLRMLPTMNVSSAGGLNSELQAINYGNGLNGGSVAGAIAGAFILGPIGAVIGGFLGQLFGGKSLGDVKEEVYTTFVDTVRKAWDSVAEVCNQDIIPQRTASFLNNLEQAVAKQLEEFKFCVNSEIKKKELEWLDQLTTISRAQINATELRQTVEQLQQWRTIRRTKLVV